MTPFGLQINSYRDSLLSQSFILGEGDHCSAVDVSLPAHCKNSIDGQWYCFDDSDVHSIVDDHVCKQTAYILFYQRRATIPSWSANSSVGGMSSPCLHHALLQSAVK